MAAFTKINSFVEAIAEGIHTFGTDQIVVALTPAASPPNSSDAVLTDLTPIAYTYLSSRNVTTTASIQVGGTYKLTLTDLTLTCSGGTAAAFRYVVLYNDGAAADQLIGFYDYGSDVTLNDGDTFQIDFDDANGCLQIA